MAALKKKKVVESRGASDLVYAIISKDDTEAYTTGEVKHLIPLAELSKSTDTASDSHYYDDVPALNITAEGPDKISIKGALIDLETLAEILGKSFDPDTGLFSDAPANPPYVAIGYKSTNSDGSSYYAWRLKGTFAIPPDNAKTKDSGTDGIGTELEYTGIYTEHIFTKGRAIKNSMGSVTHEAAPSKGVKINVPSEKVDVSTFFDEVTTPDTLKKKEELNLKTTRTKSL